MKLALTVRFGYDEELIFAQQLGDDAVIVRVDAPDPRDINLSPAAHRVRVAGLQLAGVELTGLADTFQPWSDGLLRALRAAASAGVDTLLCALPSARPATFATDLEATVTAATGTGVTVCLDAARLLPAELATLPAGSLCLELALGLPPTAAGPSVATDAATRIQAGGVRSVRFEGEGRPLGDTALDVPGCMVAIARAGYDGLIRPGAAPLLAQDDDWKPKGAANDLGYLRGVLQALHSVS